MSKKRKSIRMKLMLPVYILFVIFCVSTFLTMHTIFQARDAMQSIQNVQTRQIELADELQLNVVQVQQFLTDISATRAQDGLDDGMDVAAEHAARVREIITELEELMPDYRQDLESVRADFEVYYESGIKMANAYIKSGPAGGNKIMAEFDSAASTITEGVEKYVTVSRESMNNAIDSVNLAQQHIHWICLPDSGCCSSLDFRQGNKPQSRSADKGDSAGGAESASGRFERQGRLQLR